MKHYSEYYTCDRCGVEIKKDCMGWMKWLPIKRMKVFELDAKDAPHIKSYVTGLNVEKISDDKIAMEIVEYIEDVTNRYHLCPNCRKDFERFMRNK